MKQTIRIEDIIKKLNVSRSFVYTNIKLADLNWNVEYENKNRYMVCDEDKFNQFILKHIKVYVKTIIVDAGDYICDENQKAFEKLIKEEKNIADDDYERQLEFSKQIIRLTNNAFQTSYQSAENINARQRGEALNVEITIPEFFKKEIVDGQYKFFNLKKFKELESIRSDEIAYRKIFSSGNYLIIQLFGKTYYRRYEKTKYKMGYLLPACVCNKQMIETSLMNANAFQ